MQKDHGRLHSEKGPRTRLVTFYHSVVCLLVILIHQPVAARESGPKAPNFFSSQSRRGHVLRRENVHAVVMALSCNFWTKDTWFALAELLLFFTLCL